MTQSYSVMLARFPGGNSEHPDSSGYYMKLMSQLHKDPSVGRIIPYRIADTPITMCRNHCVRTALEEKADYVLMIDSDMSPDVNLGLDRVAQPFWETSWPFMMKRRELESQMIGTAEDVARTYGIESGVDEMLKAKPLAPCCVAAPYCGPPPHENVYVFHWRNRQNDNPNPDFYLDQFTREEAAQRGGIEEVAALPTGLILYDMRIFKVQPHPWFEYEYTDAYQTKKATTEDVFQTRNQSLLGMPCYCNWDAWAGHIKLKTVGKPVTLKVQDVHKSLIDAVNLGHNRGEQLRYVHVLPADQGKAMIDPKG